MKINEIKEVLMAKDLKVAVYFNDLPEALRKHITMNVHYRLDGLIVHLYYEDESKEDSIEIEFICKDEQSLKDHMNFAQDEIESYLKTRRAQDVETHNSSQEEIKSQSICNS